MAKKQISAKGPGTPRRSNSRVVKTDLEEVAGCLRSKRKTKTLQQMDDAISREVMRRSDRGRY